MTNSAKYDDLFKAIFGVSTDELNSEFVFGSHSWDSLAHMELIASIEDEFEIMLETEDITHFGSYENGKSILAKYGVEF